MKIICFQYNLERQMNKKLRLPAVYDKNEKISFGKNLIKFDCIIEPPYNEPK